MKALNKSRRRMAGMALAVVAVAGGLAAVFVVLLGGGLDSSPDSASLEAVSVAPPLAEGRWSEEVCALRSQALAGGLEVTTAAMEAEDRAAAAGDGRSLALIRLDIIDPNVDQLAIDAKLAAANCSGGWDLYRQFKSAIAADLERWTLVGDGVPNGRRMQESERCRSAVAEVLPDVVAAAADADHGLQLLRDRAGLDDLGELDTIWSESVEPAVTRQEILIDQLRGECIMPGDQLFHPDLFEYVTTVRRDAVEEREELLQHHLRTARQR